MNSNETNVIRFSLDSYSATKSSKSNQIATYPYSAIDLSIVFFYGADEKRKRVHIKTESETIFKILTEIISWVTAAVFCYVRKRNRLRRNGLISSYIDVQTAIYGGGNLRLNHNLEQWIFSILFFGYFFLDILYYQIVIYPAFLIFDQSIKNFKELAVVNPLIYLSPAIGDFNKTVDILLRLENNLFVDIF